MAAKQYSYLALGDSYTIGEQVPLFESFPYQLVQLLRKEGHLFQAPEILAKTGWTTDELMAAIKEYTFTPPYDFVTLLIGVNNQYRGQSLEEYATEFDTLLKKAISFCIKKQNVFVLSIPDWSATPFAKDRDTKKIAAEIDAFNQVNFNICAGYKIHYIDITAGTKEAATDDSLLTTDLLHYSGKEYGRWAGEVYKKIKLRIK